MGERAIASLNVGDLVLSVDHGRVTAVPLLETHRTAVRDHRVKRITLATGAVLEISGGHPTADGRPFAALFTGAWLGGVQIVAADEIPYAHAYTYDILPDSDSATYFAGGVLIGSTLRPNGTLVLQSVVAR